MRILASILLITLLSYISLPTIALVIEQSLEIVCIDDEENDFKIFSFFASKIIVAKVDFIKISLKIVSKTTIKNEIITSKIFIPPPDLI